MTDREKQDREYKKQLLQIAKEHERARELERVQRYRMPQDMKRGEKGTSISFPSVITLKLRIFLPILHRGLL